jgi:hypothetical protein
MLLSPEHLDSRVKGNCLVFGQEAEAVALPH